MHMAEPNEDAPFHIIRAGVIYELRPEPEGGYSISVPSLPGCNSFGDTIDDAMTMVREAIELWLDFAREEGLPIPEPFDLQKAS
jgi:predicted RNase H-like HicB family nuclease